MKISEFLSKYIFTDGSTLTIKQRVILLGIIIGVPVFLLVSDYLNSKDVLILEMLVIFLVIVLPIAYSFIFADKLNEKYGRFSQVRFGYTYQRSLNFVSFIYPGILCVILFLANFFNKLLLGSLLSLAFVIPFISACFRTGVFNDSSCYLGGEVVFGYHPICHTFSILAGLLGFYNVYNLFNVNFNGAALLFIVTVLFQVIFIIPNRINGIVPIEIRKKEGFILYNALTGAVYLLISFLFMGSAMFPPIHLNLTPEGMIRKTIVWGIGIIFAILIIRQAMNMGKRKNK